MILSSLRTRMLGLVAVAALGACTTTEFVERPLFNPPIDQVNGFLGYQVASQKRTSCGNCHVGTQAKWRTSAHTKGWEGLQKAGAAAQPACFSCHAVSANGNRATGQAGIAVRADSQYHDIQCESCHGPGLQHVNNPEIPANLPLARANVTTGFVTAAGATVGFPTGLDSDASCASCHGNTHPDTPSLASEWATSRHGRVLVSPAGNPSCANCHNGKETIKWLGGDQTPTYPEATNTTPGQQQFFPVTCTACHDPHGSPNSGMLRAPVNTPDLSRNLCMQCHNRSATPGATFTSGSRGAHSAQGPIVAGFGFGYIPAGFAFDSASPAATAHNSDRNPKLCASCHVGSFEVPNPAGGAPLRYSGHRFLANPCVGSNGIPTAAQDCAYTTAARNWSTCVSSGCHVNADNARSSFVSRQAVVATLVNTIFQNTNNNFSSSGAAIVDPAPTDGGLLAVIRQVEPTAFTSAGLSAAEGALFNAYTLGANLYSHKDGSFGTHNPAFYGALLAATIEDLRARYPFVNTYITPEVEALVRQELSRPGVTYRPPANIVGRGDLGVQMSTK